LAGLVREGYGMVITHHALQHILSAPSQHTGYSVVYLIALVPNFFSKKSELCSSKNHLVLRKSALVEKEQLTEVCVLLVEGVRGLCKCEVGIYECFSWV
jgi:hypothetical protein